MIKDKARKAIELLRQFPKNVLYVAGLVSFVYGWWQVWHPLGWILGGVLAVLLSFIIDKHEDKSGRG